MFYPSACVKYCVSHSCFSSYTVFHSVLRLGFLICSIERTLSIELVKRLYSSHTFSGIHVIFCFNSCNFVTHLVTVVQQPCSQLHVAVLYEFS